MTAFLEGPYIGVSGIIEGDHAPVAELAMRAGLPQTGWELALGVKAGFDPQVRGLADPYYGPDWYPVGDQLRAALDPEQMMGKGVLQFVTDGWEDFNDHARPLIDAALERSTPWLAAIEFDKLPWMTDIDTSNRVLRHTAKRTGRGALPIILRADSRILGDHLPPQLVPRLEELAEEGLISGLILEGLVGREVLPGGLSLISAWLSKLELEFPHLQRAVTGDIDSYVVQTEIKRLIESQRQKAFSWDAERYLHESPPGKGGSGRLIRQQVQTYLQTSVATIMANKLTLPPKAE